MNNSLIFFSTEQGNMLVRILLAHLTSDFIFQTKRMVNEKKWFSTQMLIHIAIVYLSTALLTGWWFGSAIIAITHYVIDGLKISIQKKNKYSEISLFISDQLVHTASIILIWAAYNSSFKPLQEAICLPISNYNFSLLLLAYLLVTTPVSYLIRHATQNIKKRKSNTSHDEEEKTENGGKLIGIFERIIILTFVLLGQYEAIGFLITGKSIIRFANNKEHIESEYVLVGTMMSYAISIVIGVCVNWFIKL